MNRYLFAALLVLLCTEKAEASALAVSAAAGVGQLSLESSPAKISDPNSPDTSASAADSNLIKPWFSSLRADGFAVLDIDPTFNIGLGLGMEYVETRAKQSTPNLSVSVLNSAFLIEPSTRISLTLDKNFTVDAGVGYSFLSVGSSTIDVSNFVSNSGVVVAGAGSSTVSLKAVNSLRIRFGLGTLLNQRNNLSGFISYEFISSGEFRDADAQASVKFGGQKLGLGISLPLRSQSRSLEEDEPASEVQTNQRRRPSNKNQTNPGKKRKRI